MAFTCNIDNRSFSTKKALAQHRKDRHSVPLAMQSSAPRSRASGRRSNRGGRARGTMQRNNSARLNTSSRMSSGYDLIGTATINSKSPIGSIVYLSSVNPLTVGATRLQQEAGLWTKWRPNLLQLEVVSSASDMVSGSYIVGWTGDSAEDFPSGEETLRRVASLNPSKSVRLSNKLLLNIPTQLTQRWLYCSSREKDDSCHGSIVAALSAGVGAITDDSKITISFYLRWKVTFDGPHIPQVITSQSIFADEDYVGYHTTSVTNWADGTKLSLKAHAGGGLVPFPAAKPQTVYKLDDAAKLEYYVNAKDKAEIEYAVLIPNYAVKAFAVFADQKKAVAFAGSGDSSYCLTYFAAGPTVDPDNPPWRVAASSLEVRSGQAAIAAELERLRALVARAGIEDVEQDPGYLGFQLLTAQSSI